MHSLIHRHHTGSIGRFALAIAAGAFAFSFATAKPTPLPRLIEQDGRHVAENEFVVLGTQCRVAFQPSGANKNKASQLLKAEEGRYEGGTLKLVRLRNGDEVGWATFTFASEPALVRATFTTW